MESNASASGSPCTDISNAGASRIGGKKGLHGKLADYFSMPYVSSTKFSPLGLSLKMSRGCSIQMIAKTCKESSANLPNAIIWDSGECLMLNISESPKNAVAFSWSQVLDVTPAKTSLLMPHQWSQYLYFGCGVTRAPWRCLGWPYSHGGGQWLLHHYGAANFLSLKRTDGIRWLSGPERVCVTWVFLGDFDETNAAEAFSAGNAVCPQIARWIAEIPKSVMTPDELTASVLKVLRNQFFADLTDKQFYQEQSLLLQAITHPAAWLSLRGARLSSGRYLSNLCKRSSAPSSSRATPPKFGDSRFTFSTASSEST